MVANDDCSLPTMFSESRQTLFRLQTLHRSASSKRHVNNECVVGNRQFPRFPPKLRCQRLLFSSLPPPYQAVFVGQSTISMNFFIAVFILRWLHIPVNASHEQTSTYSRSSKFWELASTAAQAGVDDVSKHTSTLANTVPSFMFPMGNKEEFSRAGVLWLPEHKATDSLQNSVIYINFLSKQRAEYRNIKSPLCTPWRRMEEFRYTVTYS
jgi:hypothetical protein